MALLRTFALVALAAMLLVANVDGASLRPARGTARISWGSAGRCFGSECAKRVELGWVDAQLVAHPGKCVYTHQQPSVDGSVIKARTSFVYVSPALHRLMLARPHCTASSIAGSPGCIAQDHLPLLITVPIVIHSDAPRPAALWKIDQDNTMKWTDMTDDQATQYTRSLEEGPRAAALERLITDYELAIAAPPGSPEGRPDRVALLRSATIAGMSSSVLQSANVPRPRVQTDLTRAADANLRCEIDCARGSDLKDTATAVEQAATTLVHGLLNEMHGAEAAVRNVARPGPRPPLRNRDTRGAAKHIVQWCKDAHHDVHARSDRALIAVTAAAATLGLATPATTASWANWTEWATRHLPIVERYAAVGVTPSASVSGTNATADLQQSCKSKFNHKERGGLVDATGTMQDGAVITGTLLGPEIAATVENEVQVASRDRCQGESRVAATTMLHDVFLLKWELWNGTTIAETRPMASAMARAKDLKAQLELVVGGDVTVATDLFPRKPVGAVELKQWVVDCAAEAALLASFLTPVNIEWLHKAITPQPGEKSITATEWERVVQPYVDINTMITDMQLRLDKKKSATGITTEALLLGGNVVHRALYLLQRLYTAGLEPKVLRCWIQTPVPKNSSPDRRRPLTCPSGMSKVAHSKSAHIEAELVQRLVEPAQSGGMKGRNTNYAHLTRELIIDDAITNARRLLETATDKKAAFNTLSLSTQQVASAALGAPAHVTRLMTLSSNGQTIRVVTAYGTTPVDAAVPIAGGVTQGGLPSMPRWNTSMNLTVRVANQDGGGYNMEVTVNVTENGCTEITVAVSSYVDDNDFYQDLDQQRARLPSEPELLEKISWMCIFMGVDLCSVKTICMATRTADLTDPPTIVTVGADGRIRRGKTPTLDDRASSHKMLGVRTQPLLTQDRHEPAYAALVKQAQQFAGNASRTRATVGEYALAIGAYANSSFTVKAVPTQMSRARLGEGLDAPLLRAGCATLGITTNADVYGALLFLQKPLGIGCMLPSDAVTIETIQTVMHILNGEAAPVQHILSRAMMKPRAPGDTEIGARLSGAFRALHLAIGTPRPAIAMGTADEATVHATTINHGVPGAVFRVLSADEQHCGSLRHAKVPLEDINDTDVCTAITTGDHQNLSHWTHSMPKTLVYGAGRTMRKRRITILAASVRLLDQHMLMDVRTEAGQRCLRNNPTALRLAREAEECVLHVPREATWRRMMDATTAPGTPLLAMIELEIDWTGATFTGKDDIVHTMCTKDLAKLAAFMVEVRGMVTPHTFQSGNLEVGVDCSKKDNCKFPAVVRAEKIMRASAGKPSLGRTLSLSTRGVDQLEHARQLMLAATVDEQGILVSVYWSETGCADPPGWYLHMYKKIATTLYSDGMLMMDYRVHDAHGQHVCTHSDSGCVRNRKVHGVCLVPETHGASKAVAQRMIDTQKQGRMPWVIASTEIMSVCDHTVCYSEVCDWLRNPCQLLQLTLRDIAQHTCDMRIDEAINALKRADVPVVQHPRVRRLLSTYLLATWAERDAFQPNLDHATVQLAIQWKDADVPCDAVTHAAVIIPWTPDAPDPLHRVTHTEAQERATYANNVMNVEPHGPSDADLPDLEGGVWCMQCARLYPTRMFDVHCVADPHTTHTPSPISGCTMAVTATVFNTETGEGVAAATAVLPDVARGANDSYYGEGRGLGMAHDLTTQHQATVVSTDSESNVKTLHRMWDVNVSARRRNNSSVPGCLACVVGVKTQLRHTSDRDVTTIFGSAAHDLQLHGRGRTTRQTANHTADTGAKRAVECAVASNFPLPRTTQRVTEREALPFYLHAFGEDRPVMSKMKVFLKARVDDKNIATILGDLQRHMAPQEDRPAQNATAMLLALLDGRADTKATLEVERRVPERLKATMYTQRLDHDPLSLDAVARMAGKESSKGVRALLRALQRAETQCWVCLSTHGGAAGGSLRHHTYNCPATAHYREAKVAIIAEHGGRTGDTMWFDVERRKSRTPSAPATPPPPGVAALTMWLKNRPRPAGVTQALPIIDSRGIAHYVAARKIVDVYSALHSASKTLLACASNAAAVAAHVVEHMARSLTTDADDTFITVHPCLTQWVCHTLGLHSVVVPMMQLPVPAPCEHVILVDAGDDCLDQSQGAWPDGVFAAVAIDAEDCALTAPRWKAAVRKAQATAVAGGRACLLIVSFSGAARRAAINAECRCASAATTLLAEFSKYDLQVGRRGGPTGRLDKHNAPPYQWYCDVHTGGLRTPRHHDVMSAPRSHLRVEMDFATLVMFHANGTQVQRPLQHQLQELAWVLTGTAPTINVSGRSSQWVQNGLIMSLALRDQPMRGVTGPEHIARYLNWEHTVTVQAGGAHPSASDQVKQIEEECRAAAHGTCPAHGECVRGGVVPTALIELLRATGAAARNITAAVTATLTDQLHVQLMMDDDRRMATLATLRCAGVLLADDSRGAPTPGGRLRGVVQHTRDCDTCGLCVTAVTRIDSISSDRQLVAVQWEAATTLLREQLRQCTVGLSERAIDGIIKQYHARRPPLLCVLCAAKACATVWSNAGAAVTPNAERERQEADALLQLCRQLIDTAPTSVVFHRIEADGVGVAATAVPTVLQALDRSETPAAKRLPKELAKYCNPGNNMRTRPCTPTARSGQPRKHGGATGSGGARADRPMSAKRVRKNKSPTPSQRHPNAAAGEGAAAAQPCWEDSEPSEHADAVLIAAFEARPFDNMRTYEGLDRDLDYDRCARHHRRLCQEALAAAKRIGSQRGPACCRAHSLRRQTSKQQQPHTRVRDTGCTLWAAVGASWPCTHCKRRLLGGDALDTDTLQKWRRWACASQRRSAQEAPALGDARAIMSKIRQPATRTAPAGQPRGPTAQTQAPR